jgi:hypothetical protein
MRILNILMIFFLIPLSMVFAAGFVLLLYGSICKLLDGQVAEGLIILFLSGMLGSLTIYGAMIINWCLDVYEFFT